MFACMRVQWIPGPFYSPGWDEARISCGETFTEHKLCSGQASFGKT